MLISLRTKGASLIVKLLFGLLIISFALWGVPNLYDQASQQTDAAEVGGETISLTQLRRESDRDVQQLQAAFGGKLGPEQIQQFGIVDRALDSLIERTLFAVYAEKVGMRVPDDLLARRLQSEPALQNAVGEFDPSRFAALLRQREITEDQFLDSLRRDTVNGQLVGAMQPASAAPKTLASALYAFRKETRVAETILVTDSSIVDLPAPDEAALKTYHDENSSRYEAPEYRTLTIVRFDPEDRADESSVTEEDVVAEYESRKAEFEQPETRVLEQIVYPDEAAARAAYDKIVQGSTPLQIAQETVKRDPIQLGIVTEVQLSKVLGEKLAEAAFATQEGKPAEPMFGPVGWHVVIVKKVTPGSAQVLADVHARLAHDIAVRNAVDGIIELTNKLEDALGSGMTLAEAAQSLELPVETVAAVDPRGNGPDGKAIAGMADDGVSLPTAFATAEGEDSDLAELPNGGYLMVHVDGITLAAVRPLDEVREQATADWQASERQRLAAEKAQAIAERIQGGETLAKIAEETGLVVKVTRPFTRDAGDDAADLTPALAANIFELEIGAVATNRNAKDDGEVVAVLREIKPVDVAAADKDLSEMQDSLSRAIAADLFEQFSTALRQEISVTKNQDAVDALYR
ncbi:MAG: SurA N-terminal domain-containing protein [Dongiaceae bacterium]